MANDKGISSSKNVENTLKESTKAWAQAGEAATTWDIQGLERAMKTLDQKQSELSTYWQEARKDLLELEQLLHDSLKESTYAVELEQCLRTAGIPLQRNFPEYDFPPFKLVIDSEAMEARLIYGRKVEKTRVLQPTKLSEWVALRYQKVVGKKFDAKRLMKELMGAYQYANRYTYRGEDVLWGRAISLELLYDLLTLRKPSKQDYPKSLYLYELGLLKEQPDLSVDGFAFEFGFAREQSKALVLVDSRGRESRVSSLTIYQDGGES